MSLRQVCPRKVIATLLQTTACTVRRHAEALGWTGLAGTLPQLLGATMFFNVFDDPPAVRVRKGYVGRRPRTWLALTREGQRVFERHLDALREIATG